jgi:hypothetical protein
VLLLALGCSLGLAVHVFPAVEDVYGLGRVDPLVKLSEQLLARPCDQTTLLRYADVVESRVGAHAAAEVIDAIAARCSLSRPALERGVRLHIELGQWNLAQLLTGELRRTYGGPYARDLWLRAVAEDAAGDVQCAAEDYLDAVRLDVAHGDGALFRAMLDRPELGGPRLRDRIDLISSTPVDAFAARLRTDPDERARRARALAAALN